jgi:hypothetical protein
MNNMSKGRDINKLVEETMNSLDGMTGAEASPWLYSKLQARMKAPLQPMLPLWLRPQLVVPVLTLLIGLNIWSLTGSVTQNSTTTSTACDFASYYNMGSCDSDTY